MHHTLKEDLEAAFQDPQDTLLVVGSGVSIAATNNEHCASWRGLIEDGIDFCLRQELANSEWAALRRQQLKSGETDELIGAADLIQKTLGGTEAGYYQRWLEDSIGRIKTKNFDLVNVLACFAGPIATTNYDGLLEEATGRRSLTWRKAAEVERVLREDKQSIIHLHGFWEEPESIILGVRDYERHLRNERAQGLQNAIGALRNIVFVGCGHEGLADPNLGPLIDWVMRAFHDSRFHHYLLCRNNDALEFERRFGKTGKIRIVRYGDGYGDLAPFLQSLIPRRASLVTDVATGGATIKGNTDTIPSRLPVRPPRCIGRDTAVERLVTTLLRDRVPPTPVLGTAGIGKSTVTLRALHDERVARRFGARRFFVRCDVANDVEALLTQIALELQFLPGTALQERLLVELDREPTILVLDNLETPWEKDVQNVEDLLTRLGDLNRLALIVSIRGKARPAGPAWLDPPFELEPLGREDSRQTFLSIAGKKFEIEPRLENFLAALEGVPLAIELLAYVCQAEPNLDGVWILWEQRRTEILRRTGSLKDKTSPRQVSLEASYELSLGSPRMTKQALRLLKVLGLLPMGFAVKGLQELPAPMMAVQGAMTLRQMGLVFDEAGRLRLLAPLREFISRRHRPSKGDRDLLVTRYLGFIASDSPLVGSAEGKDAFRRLSAEVANLEVMIELGLEQKDPQPAIKASVQWAEFVVYSGLGTTRPLRRTLDAARRLKSVENEARCFFMLGRIALRRPNLQQAKEYYRQGLALYKRVKKVHGQANCIHCLGEVALHGSQIDESEKYFNEARSLYQRLNDSLGIANSFLSLGEVAMRRFHVGDAVAKFEDALAIFRRIQEVHGEANCIRLLGVVDQRQAAYDDASSKFWAALRLFQQVDELLGQANCYSSLGEIDYRRSRFDEANSHFGAALGLYGRLGQLLGQANCIHGYGQILLQQSRLDDAVLRFQEALDLYLQIGERQGRANCIFGMGEAAALRSDLARAVLLFQEALSLYQQIGNPHGQAICIYSLGKVSIQRSRPDEAFASVNEALGLFRKTADVGGQASCITSLGEVELLRNNPGEAISWFEQALVSHQKAESIAGQADCLHGLGVAAAQRMLPDAALRHLQAALVLYGKLPSMFGIGRVHGSLARIAQVDAAVREEHLGLAVAAWKKIGNTYMCEKLLEEFR